MEGLVQTISIVLLKPDKVLNKTRSVTANDDGILRPEPGSVPIHVAVPDMATILQKLAII